RRLGAVPRRLPAAPRTLGDPGADLDVRQDLRAVVRDRLAARDVPAPARGPAPAVRVDQARAGDPAVDPRRGVREGGDGVAMATKETQGAQQNTQKEQGIGLGLLTGLSVTLRTMLKRSVTVQYPHVKPD